jgi:hypothetical protein
LSGRQRWLVVDRDPSLLTSLHGQMPSWAAGWKCQVDAASATACVVRGDDLECHVESRCLNLTSLEVDIFAGRQLVTASALLDLTSETWLRTLAARCREVGAAALFTITYNGYSSCWPAEPEDDMVRHLLNQHQKTDKGLGGSAAGPDAAHCASRCFADAGYQVWTDSSDWVLGSAERDVQRLLVDGWATAATEVAPGDASTIANWRARRLEHLDAGDSQIVVGHSDIAACLPQD